jgi:hypothetical protein
VASNRFLAGKAGFLLESLIWIFRRR